MSPYRSHSTRNSRAVDSPAPSGRTAIRWLHWPDAPEGAGAVEFAERHRHLSDEEFRAELEALIVDGPRREVER